VFKFDLSETREDELFALPMGANWLRVIELSADATVTVRLNRSDADKIPLVAVGAYCYSEAGLIYEIYVSNTAQSKKSVTFASGLAGVGIDPGG
jgi:hypothetical protein